MIHIHQDTTETAINASKVLAVVKDNSNDMVTVKTDGEDFEFSALDENSDEVDTQLERLYQAILAELSTMSCV